MSRALTPGPWEACDRGDYTDEGCVVLGPDKLGNPRVGIAYLEADAHLIAAAPDLYEALGAICNLSNYDDIRDAKDIASAALKQARGEA